MRISDWSSDVCSSDLPGADPFFMNRSSGLGIVLDGEQRTEQQHRPYARHGEQTRQGLPPCPGDENRYAETYERICQQTHEHPPASEQECGEQADRKSTRLNSSH